jgi:hypothetical protein
MKGLGGRDLGGVRRYSKGVWRVLMIVEMSCGLGFYLSYVEVLWDIKSRVKKY